MLELSLLVLWFVAVGLAVAMDSRNRHVVLVAGSVLLLIIVSLVGMLWVVSSTEAQDAPVIIQADPVVIPGGQPEIWWVQWFIEDVQNYGFTEAVKSALGYGRNQDGWIEYVLVFELKYSRAEAEQISRDLYRFFFGQPEFIPTRWTY